MTSSTNMSTTTTAEHYTAYQPTPPPQQQQQQHPYHQQQHHHQHHQQQQQQPITPPYHHQLNQHQQQPPHSPLSFPFSFQIPTQQHNYHSPPPNHYHYHYQQQQQQQQQQTIINQQDHYHPSPLRPSPFPKSSHIPSSPFISPKPHWQQHSPRLFRSPPSQSNSPRHHAQLIPKSPYSSASSPSTQGPRSPSSIATPSQPLVRGSLAQAKLRGHHYIPATPPLADRSKNPSSPRLNRPALPKPPCHSQFALWVGNIPSDATHEELCKFFAGRPIHNNNHRNKFIISDPPANIPNSGVESIHLIARSNCAFVNYTSHQQLEQAIANCNGKPLRPMDPFCKPLLCRVRKPEDNIKSGVGAQRIGGMHRSWVKRFDPPPSKPSSHARIDPNNQDHLSDSTNNRTSSTLTSTSNQSQSTTSSFLASHFPRRYFILKSYTDEDLRISVERSIWVSQTHNEPVLDQAYRTSPEGVFLIFSTNQSGEFFGYAKMAGPIWKPGRRYSAPTSPTPDSGKPLRARSVSISGSGCPRRNLGETTGDRSTAAGFENVFGVQDPLTISSPRALTPVEGERTTATAANTHFSPSRRSLPILSSQNLLNSSPLQPYSYGPHQRITHRSEEEHHPFSIRSNMMLPSTRSRSGSNTTTGSRHSLHDSLSEDHPDLMSGRPFKVEWIRVQSLNFYRTKNLRNPFNGNREVKVSRDGTEVEPSVGQAILDEIDKEYFRLNNNNPPS